MKPSPGLQATAVWLLLMLATGCSWRFSAGGGNGVQPLVTIGVVLIAFIKVRLIIMHFMEVAKAPALLRRICEAWLVSVCGALIALYRFASG